MKSKLILLLALSSITLSFAWIGRPLLDVPTRSTNLRHQDKDQFHSIFSNQLNGMQKPLNIRGGSSSLEMTNPLITSLVPKVGIITSTLLYFSPMAAVRAASKDETLGDLNPIPLAIMAVSSMCWLVYGLSVRDPYVTLSNVPGSIASIWYITAVLPLLKGKQLETTQNTVVALSAITINLWTYLSLSCRSLVQIRSLLGMYASSLFVILSSSPLSTIKTVLSSRNSASILSSFTMAQCTNCALWTAYGLAIKDVFVTDLI